MVHAHTILKAPIITEKSTHMREDKNLYCFRVSPGASKVDIRNTVEKVFGVKVDWVRTVRVRGKNKRFGRRMGRSPDWKKAYVRLKEGEKPIEYFEGV